MRRRTLKYRIAGWKGEECEDASAEGHCAAFMEDARKEGKAADIMCATSVHAYNRTHPRPLTSASPPALVCVHLHPHIHIHMHMTNQLELQVAATDNVLVLIPAIPQGRDGREGEDNDSGNDNVYRHNCWPG